MRQNIVSAGKSTSQFFARQRGIASSEEIRKFGKSFGLRFTAWIRLSTRHFSDDESTTLVQELLLRVRDDTKPGARERRDSEIRIRKDSARPFSSFSFFLDKTVSLVRLHALHDTCHLIKMLYVLYILVSNCRTRVNALVSYID